MSSLEGGKSCVSLKNRGLICGRLSRVNRWKTVFEGIKFLSESEITVKSEFQSSAGSNLQMCNFCWMGRLLKKVQ